MVSMIYDYGRKQWPDYNKWNEQIKPLIQPFPTKEQLQAWLDLLKAAKQFDDKTDQPDCEDSAKEDILKSILKRLDALEKK